MAKKKATTPEVVQEAITEEVTNVPAQTEMPQLQIADLQNISKIIDVASRRGAFHAEEFTQVGEAFNKLNNFLRYVESTATTTPPVAEESKE